MKQTILAALLALACGHALAEWTSLGDVGNAELFIDKTTIARNGDKATMWSIYALKTPGSAGGASYVSLKRQDEFDCKASLTRPLQIAAYPKPMAEGKAVADEKSSAGWAAPAPQSIAEKLLQVACAKD